MNIRNIITSLTTWRKPWSYSYICKELNHTKQLLELSVIEAGKIRREYDDYQMQVCRDKGQLEMEIKRLKEELSDERSLAEEMARHLEGTQMLTAMRSVSKANVLDAYSRQNSRWRR